MPYINHAMRKKLNPDIEALADALYRDGNIDDGEVNFAITRLLCLTYGLNIKYSVINRIMGVLECVKLEFYRRIAAPYEDTKKHLNGDVY